MAGGERAEKARKREVHKSILTKSCSAQQNRQAYAKFEAQKKNIQEQQVGSIGTINDIPHSSLIPQ